MSLPQYTLQGEFKAFKTTLEMKVDMLLKLHNEFEKASRSDSILICVFVDDRAFAGARVWDLMERYHAWCAWSFSVGLLENQQKTVVVASTPARRATLRKFWPGHIATNAELLGSCSMVACRGLMPRELERVTACKRVLSLLACIGLPFDMLHARLSQFRCFKGGLWLDCPGSTLNFVQVYLYLRAHG